jgi:hypothetical protein
LLLKRWYDPPKLKKQASSKRKETRAAPGRNLAIGSVLKP